LPAVFFYISGHGFGHASRQIAVINALGAMRPGIAIAVRTSAARWLFDRTCRVPITFLPGDCDTGVTQIDSLRLDAGATIRRAADFYRSLPARVDEETQLLRAHETALVVADAAPLGCAAATAAGVPSVVITNFTWDWIYEAYAEELADAPDLVPAIQAAYRGAAAAWRLPMHGGFEPFERIVDLPFIARHAQRPRDEVRDALGLPRDRPLVLASFGGYGVDGLDVGRLDCLQAFGVVLTPGNEAAIAPEVPAGIHHVAKDRLYGSGLRYEDLVAACDVVATKPGYGIIAECIANETAILYTSRGRFREYEVLVAEMPRYLRCAFIDHDALFTGRWRAPLEQIMSSPVPPERPRTDGARVAAALIADAADRRTC
jgi:hypothetical protein